MSQTANVHATKGQLCYRMTNHMLQNDDPVIKCQLQKDMLSFRDINASCKKICYPLVTYIVCWQHILSFGDIPRNYPDLRLGLVRVSVRVRLGLGLD
jgi:hypothetical protein